MQFAFLVMSCVILLFALFGAFFFLKNPSKRLLLLIAGFFVSGVLLFIPLFNAKYDIPSSIVFSSIQSMQMFLLNSNFNDMTDGMAPAIHLFYNIFLGVLHLFAPLLLATAILSLITDKVNLLKCHIPLKNKYIFSEINKKSVALATTKFLFRKKSSGEHGTGYLLSKKDPIKHWPCISNIGCGNRVAPMRRIARKALS